MFFSCAVFAILAFGGLSAVASPTPVVVEKRQDVSEVLGIIDALSGTVDGILSQLGEWARFGVAFSVPYFATNIRFAHHWWYRY
jgi:hypothetical protein